MRLNVEISATSNYYAEDKLRRLLKRNILDAVSDTLDGDALPYAELLSLKFVKPTTRKRKAAS